MSKDLALNGYLIEYLYWGGKKRVFLTVLVRIQDEMQLRVLVWKWPKKFFLFKYPNRCSGTAKVLILLNRSKLFLSSKAVCWGVVMAVR